MSLDYMKVLKKGLMSLGEDIALSGLEEVAKCLLKLVGYKTSKEKKEEEFRVWAASVTANLETLDTKLNELTNQLSTGISELNTAISFSNYQTQYNQTVNSRSFINDCYNMLTGILKRSPGLSE